MRIAVIFDSFKGCMSSAMAGEAAARGLRDADTSIEPIVIVAADGGEGMSEAIHLAGIGEVVSCPSHDPLMRPIFADYTFDKKKSTAYIDLAASSGITHLDENEKNPMKTTTFGLGEMIADAIRRSAETIYIGLGGSATNDCAAGALQALGVKFYDCNLQILLTPITGETLCKIEKIDATEMSRRLKGVKLHLLCDVTNPLFGENGATAVFAPQKGADRQMCRQLEKGVIHFANTTKNSDFIDEKSTPGAGAAGGAGFGLSAIAGADILPGAETLFELIDAKGRIEGCRAILTGEGSSDAQSLMGKLPVRILKLGNSLNIDTFIFSGKVEDKEELLRAGFTDVIDINSPMKSNKIDIFDQQLNPLDPTVAALRLRCHVADEFWRIRNKY